MAASNAGPVESVLNSLTSPGMVGATLACLAWGAHVAEISKRDIWSPQRVAQERPDVQYRLVAIDFLPPAVRTWLAHCKCVCVCVWYSNAWLDIACCMQAHCRLAKLLLLLAVRQVLQPAPSQQPGRMCRSSTRPCCA